MKEIEKLCLEPLSDEEATVTNGGFGVLATIGVGLLVAYIADVCANTEEHAEAAKKGWEAGQK